MIQPDRALQFSLDAESYNALTIVVPTYREVDNIPPLLARIDALRQSEGLDIEVLFMDDDSQDGSVEAVRDAGFDWARIIVRTENRGLSPAVLDGFDAASHPILVCMDCDLSHPPEAIPSMLLSLRAGHEMVIGSRYVKGGTTDDDWGFGRWLNSIIATLLARPLTRVLDPMSGFFALRRESYQRAKDLNPIGYKIALEIIVKCEFQNVDEVPIHFSDRIHGESKLTFKEQLRYIQHLRRLYLYRFANAMHVAQFLVVGFSGLLINLLVLTVLKQMGAPNPVALAGGIGVSLVTNFVLNRRFTFSYARHGHVIKQFIGFLGASAVGLIVNYSVSLWLSGSLFEGQKGGLQFAAISGVMAGMLFNFLGNRYLVFRKRHIRK